MTRNTCSALARTTPCFLLRFFCEADKTRPGLRLYFTAQVAPRARAALARLGAVRRNQRLQPRPEHHCIHLAKKNLSLGLLLLVSLLKRRKTLLFQVQIPRNSCQNYSTEITALFRDFLASNFPKYSGGERSEGAAPPAEAQPRPPPPASHFCGLPEKCRRRRKAVPTINTTLKMKAGSPARRTPCCCATSRLPLGLASPAARRGVSPRAKGAPPKSIFEKWKLISERC